MLRIKAWELREAVREHRLAPMRLRACGAYRYRREVTLKLGEGGGAWWDGVIQCRSRTCPPCFLARRYKAAKAIETVVHEREQETRQQSYLITLTIRHHAGDPIALVKAIRVAWRTLLQSRAFRSWKEDHGVEWICVEEITLGENGWHPHLHTLCMPRTKIDASDLWSLSSIWFEWWRKIVVKKLGAEHEPSRMHGCDLTPCDSAAYLTKLGMELADPLAVKGSAPLALLAGGRIEEYMELQRYRSRARDLTFSRGLSQLRAVLKDLEEPAESADLIAIRGIDWYTLRALGWAKPLEVCEATDPATAVEAMQKILGPSYLPAEIGGVPTFTRDNEKP